MAQRRIILVRGFPGEVDVDQDPGDGVSGKRDQGSGLGDAIALRHKLADRCEHQQRRYKGQ